MPSIFNHENACWGIKKPFCSVFHYDLTEELQTGKLTAFTVPPSSNIQAPMNNCVHYSVSSNGYYGFQPHNIIQRQTNEDNAMEVEENYVPSPVGLPPGNNSAIESTVLRSQICHTQNRKRPMLGNGMENTKRMRQEGVVDTMQTVPVQDSQQCGVRHRRCCLSRVDLQEGYESQLLRETHGCEVFLYERTCDY